MHLIKIMHVRLICALIVFFFQGTELQAQQEFDIVSKSGFKTGKINDDPSKLPMYSFYFSPFNPITYGKGGVLGYDLQFNYRFGNRFSIRTKLVGGYFKAVETYNVFPMLDAGGYFNCRFWEGFKYKDKKTPVNVVEGSHGDTVYYVVIPRSKRRSLSFSGGVNFWKYNSSVRISEFGETFWDPNREFIGSDLKSRGVSIGIEYESSRSYKAQVENKTRSHFSVSRFYVYTSFGISNDFKIYELTYDSDYSRIYTDKTEDFGPFELNKIGFRMGYEHARGFKNRSLGWVIGGEFVVVPQYRFYHKGNEFASEIGMFAMHVGLIFGSNPWE